MNIRVLPLVACLCGALPTPAQDFTALAGNWQGHAALPGGLRVEVMVRVEGAQGTWTAMPLMGLREPNPCLARPLPMALTDLAAEGFRIEIQASKAIPGCRDGLATVKLVDGRVLEGKFADGRPLKLERR